MKAQRFCISVLQLKGFPVVPGRQLARTLRLPFEGIVDKPAAGAIQRHHAPFEAAHFVEAQLDSVFAIGATGFYILPEQHQATTSWQKHYTAFRRVCLAPFVESMQTSITPSQSAKAEREEMRMLVEKSVAAMP